MKHTDGNSPHNQEEALRRRYHCEASLADARCEGKLTVLRQLRWEGLLNEKAFRLFADRALAYRMAAEAAAYRDLHEGLSMIYEPVAAQKGA